MQCVDVGSPAIACLPQCLKIELAQWEVRFPLARANDILPFPQKRAFLFFGEPSSFGKKNSHG